MELDVSKTQYQSLTVQLYYVRSDILVSMLNAFPSTMLLVVQLLLAYMAKIAKTANALQEEINVALEVFALTDIAYHQPADHVLEELNVLLVLPVQEGSNVKTANVS